MIKIKKFLLKLRETCPALINPIISILRFLRFYFYYKPLFLIAKLRRAKKDIDKVFWINPIKIKWSCRGKISLKKDRGKIINGNWDLHKEKFKKNITYQGIKNVFIKQKKWKETNLYKIAKNKIKKGEIFQGCYNEKALESYFKGIATLYESIKEKGFLFPPPKFNGKADPYCRK